MSANATTAAGSPFPKSWLTVTLPEIGELSRGKSKHRPRNEPKLYGGAYPFIQTGDIRESGGTIRSHTQTYSELGLSQSRLWPAGTMCITIAANIGETGILTYPACFPDSVVGFRHDGDPATVRFIELFFRIAKSELERLAPATAQKNINVDILSKLPIPFPPLPEQQRIVAEIEKQFTRLEAGMAALRRVQANLKRYRAAVLKAACEGQLVPTEAELHRPRKTNSAPLETGAELLTRILAERQKNWIGRGKYKEPAAPDTTNLPQLPDGWTWASVDQVGEVQLGRQRSPKNASKNFPTKYIRAANITERGLDLSDVLEKEFTPAERERYVLRGGDILLSEASGSASQVGKPAVWRDELPLCCFQNTVIRLRPFALGAKYPLTVFRHFYTNGLFAQIAGGIGINHLGAERFSCIPFPLPPLPEQTRIVAEVERRLSVVEELESVVSANLHRATRLRQSILQRAFTGNLVPQNPSDESAETLLKRINDLPDEAKLAKKKTKSKEQKTMPSKPVTTLETLLQRLDSIGGAAAPDRLLAVSGLGEEVERFFDLLREGRNNGALIVPTGANGDIKLNSHAN